MYFVDQINGEKIVFLHSMTAMSTYYNMKKLLRNVLIQLLID